MTSPRITETFLETQIFNLNLFTSSPTTYFQGDSGRASIGHFVLDRAYSGYALHRIVGTSGAVAVIGSGYMSKRELCSLIQAYKAGWGDCSFARRKDGAGK
jgi:hypothetical protein